MVIALTAARLVGRILLLLGNGFFVTTEFATGGSADSFRVDRRPFGSVESVD